MGFGDGGALVPGLFEFDDGQRQPVDVQHDVEAPAEPLLLNPDLLHRPPLVLQHLVTQQAQGRRLLQPGRVGVRHPPVAVGEQIVKRLVLADRILRLGLQQIRRRLLQELVRHARVETAQRREEVLAQHQVTQRGPLRLHLAARVVRPADLPQPIEQITLPLRFGDHLQHLLRRRDGILDANSPVHQGRQQGVPELSERP